MVAATKKALAFAGARIRAWLFWEVVPGGLWTRAHPWAETGRAWGASLVESLVEILAARANGGTPLRELI